jgi:hypothetical protein
VTSQIENGASHSIGATVLSRVESPEISGTCDPSFKTGRKYVEPGAFAADGSFVYVANPSADDLIRSYGLLASEIPSVAPFDVVVRVYEHNPFSWWVLWRSADETRRTPEMAGLATYVPLNARGLKALRRGEFAARDPDLRFVTKRGDDPHALYLWGLVAHGLSDIIGKLVGHAIGLDVYETLPMIGTIGTEEGLAALRRSTKSALDAAALTIGSTFEIKLPQRHLEHRRAMRVWEGAARIARVD